MCIDAWGVYKCKYFTFQFRFLSAHFTFPLLLNMSRTWSHAMTYKKITGALIIKLTVESERANKNMTWASLMAMNRFRPFHLYHFCHSECVPQVCALYQTLARRKWVMALSQEWVNQSCGVRWIHTLVYCKKAFTVLSIFNLWPFAC